MYTFLGFIAKPLGVLLSFLYDFVGNYGITLIIVTFIIKFAMYPLYAAQVKSTSKMSKLSPKIKELQNKYKDDKETLNIKMKELYKQENFNPMSGCLPILIQMPIIMGLFALLRNPIRYIPNENMLFAVHEQFLWMPDLSQPDRWVLPILAGIATFISFSLTQKQNSSPEQAQMAPMMKSMRYIFPVMIVWMGRSFPAGLAIYWFLSQFIQIFFNLHLNRVREKIKQEK